jgi:hypothetical protein
MDAVLRVEEKLKDNYVLEVLIDRGYYGFDGHTRIDEIDDADLLSLHRVVSNIYAKVLIRYGIVYRTISAIIAAYICPINELMLSINSEFPVVQDIFKYRCQNPDKIYKINYTD